ncbi:unnamed protein product [Polarella glacialis]|uniref:Ricin B lectin domain-containing protein n=1 Tax=Polarella glacialis TaxID=89957 RepID=A0A813FUL9_POLGL|nr:unnamed protein product [Polarella glacialis]
MTPKCFDGGTPRFGAQVMWALLRSALVSSVAVGVLPLTAASERVLNGSYVIVNKASGRRLCSGPSGFSATSGGPSRAIDPEQRWLLVPQDNGTFLIENHANGMRIFAQSGKDHADGFLTTDQGPVYQDQKWRVLLQRDGSYSFVNSRSDRRIAARPGLEGAAGFVAVLGDQPVAADASWALLDPDTDELGPLLRELQLAEGWALEATTCLRLQKELQSRYYSELAAQKAEVDQLHAELNEERGLGRQLTQQAGAWEGKRSILVSELSVESSRSVLLQAKLGSCTEEKVHLAGEAASLFAYLALSVIMVGLFFAAFCRQWCHSRALLRSSRRALAEATIEQSLGSDFAHCIFPRNEPDGLVSRVVKIQCPGVEHSDVEVKLICNGCDVSICRRASLGVEAMTWTKRFCFDGSCEFCEDQMLLEHGFLNLVFREQAFRARTVRFPKHYSLAASDDDLCWEEPAGCATTACPSERGTCSRRLEDSPCSSRSNNNNLNNAVLDDSNNSNNLNNNSNNLNNNNNLVDEGNTAEIKQDTAPHRRRGLAAGGA